MPTAISLCAGNSPSRRASNCKVAAPAIRELYGVLVSEKADRGIFVTTGQFTRDAKEFAEDKPMELLDGMAFQSLMRGASSDPNDDLLNVRLWASSPHRR
jgi:restriction endonuclease Mrr